MRVMKLTFGSFHRGEFEVADGVSASVFNSVLDFYHTGVINCPPHVSVAEMREACDYFLLPFTASTVKCQNLRGLLHELSNDGAEEQFEVFLEELILPEMVRKWFREFKGRKIKEKGFLR